MDHLSDLVTDIFSDSEIAKQFHSKHTKSRAIVKHVLAGHFREELLHALAKTKFSIIIDEKTDTSSKKLLAILVRYFCDRLLEVTETDATTLVTTLTTYFESKNIPLQNIVGYASDTTNVMFGQHHSVVSGKRFHFFTP